MHVDPLGGDARLAGVAEAGDRHLRRRVAQSPDGSMIRGALLPSSRPTFFGPPGGDGPADLGEPVNVMRATSGCSTSGSPTVSRAGDDVSQPGGSPHSSIRISCRRIDEKGVWLAGFRTIGQPAAMAGATLWATRLSGKLNGQMAAMTPMGTRRVKPACPRPAGRRRAGTMSPDEGPGLDGRDLERDDRPGGLDPRRARSAWPPPRR